MESTINEFDGCRTLADIDRVNTSSTSAESVFTTYVNERRPVIFDGLLAEREWKVGNWTTSYLKRRAEDALMKAEFRDGESSRFGLGQEKMVKFGDFLNYIDSKNPNWYMTTQDLVYDTEGMPGILSAPLDVLSEDFPLVPSLFPTLIPSNINTWIGFSKSFTTSGLHHDFHDNLYVLLRGEKRFTIYSPAETMNMYTSGECVKVHPNGRINYKGQLTTADGADLHSMEAARAAASLEEAATKLHTIQTGNAVDAVDDVEDEVDRALDAVLDAEIAGGFLSDSDEEDFDGDNDTNDFDSDAYGTEDSEESGKNSTDEDGEKEEDETAAPLSLRNCNKRTAEERSHGLDSTKRSRVDKLPKSIFQYLPRHSTKQPITKGKSAGLPSNFSTVDQSLSDAEMKKRFPLFSDVRKRKAGVSFILKAGQMLYLPAGWFHEVESRNADESDTSTASAVNGAIPGQGHMAFNYWFHPPDAKEFYKPYSSPFWSDIFELQKAAMKKPSTSSSSASSSISSAK